MSRQRKRHVKRQPIEEAIRIALSDFVGAAGTVDVQRMSYDWRADDVLIHILLGHSIAGTTLLLFQRELVRILRACIPTGDPLQDWLVVVECANETLARLSAHDMREEITNE